MTHNTPSEIRLFEVLELFWGESNIHRSCETIDVGILVHLSQGVHVPIRSLRFFTELVPTTGAAEAVTGYHASVINSILLFQRYLRSFVSNQAMLTWAMEIFLFFATSSMLGNVSS